MGLVGFVRRRHLDREHEHGLDDNKKLCLMSGEIIAMSDVMSMILNPWTYWWPHQRITGAAPVYMEPEQLGLRPLFESWVTGWTVGGYYRRSIAR